jgi:hypothetical protein
MTNAHCRPLDFGVGQLGQASFEEELVTNMTYADQMHEARWGAAGCDAYEKMCLFGGYVLMGI